MQIRYNNFNGQYFIKRNKKQKTNNGYLFKSLASKIWSLGTCYDTHFTRKELEKITEFMKRLEENVG